MSSPLSPSVSAVLPSIDLHAHVDPGVTTDQLQTLQNAIVFAVTRTMDEADAVGSRNDDRILWGAGSHPGLSDALDDYTPSRFRNVLERVHFVGEVGLDRKLKHDRSLEVLADSVTAAADARKPSSIHSTGRQAAVVELIGATSKGIILHWFTGPPRLIEQAASAGAYFSINAAMSDGQISALPPSRLLPETDFPFTKRSGCKLPGDIETLERRCSVLLGLSRDDLRQMWYLNLRELYQHLDAGDAAPTALRRALLAA